MPGTDEAAAGRTYGTGKQGQRARADRARAGAVGTLARYFLLVLMAATGVVLVVWLLSVSLLQLDYRGFVLVPRGGRGTFQAEYFFAGVPRTSRPRASSSTSTCGLAEPAAVEGDVPWYRPGRCQGRGPGPVTVIEIPVHDTVAGPGIPGEDAKTHGTSNAMDSVRER